MDAIEIAAKVWEYIGPEVCATGVKLITTDVYSRINGLFNYLTDNSSTKQYEQLSARAGGLRLVRTLLHLKDRVDLADFYVPTRLRLFENITTDTNSQFDESSKRAKILQVNEAGDFGNNRQVLVQGSAGQGKSSFLRYLTLRELARGKRLPLFVELRNITSTTNLTNLLINESRTLGFKLDAGELHSLCETSDIALFIDGFDEVPRTLQQRTLTEIDGLLRMHPNLPAVVSSRPDSGAKNSNQLAFTEICHIEHHEYKRYINRFSSSPKQAKTLIDGIEGTPVASVLDTPLMVALLVFTYQLEEIIPSDKSEFYDQLFMLLVRNHDAKKDAWERERRHDIGDIAARKVFSALMYYLRKQDAMTIGFFDFCNLTAKALETFKKATGHEEDVLRDLIEITNLIHREGDTCQVIHKSIAEYYCAEYIKSRPEPVAIQFYRRAVSSGTQWNTELQLLKEADEYRYRKYYEVNELKITTKAIQSILNKINNAAVVSLLRSLRATYPLCPSGRIQVRASVEKELADPFDNLVQGFDVRYGGGDIFEPECQAIILVDVADRSEVNRIAKAIDVRSEFNRNDPEALQRFREGIIRMLTKWMEILNDRLAAAEAYVFETESDETEQRELGPDL